MTKNNSETSDKQNEVVRAAEEKKDSEPSNNDSRLNKEFKDEFGATALLHAAENNNIQIVKILLSNEGTRAADVNAKDNNGLTALCMPQ